MSSTATTYVVRGEAQLRALLDVRYGGHLLAQFGEGATASEAARRLGEPAPRVTYHVRRLTALGLLVPAQGNGQGRRLRPVAERFVVAPELRGLLQRDMAQPFLTALTDAFLGAAGPDLADHLPEGLLFDLRPGAPATRAAVPLPSHAPRALVRMVRLTPASFERACREAWEVLSAAAEADPGAPGARYFTLSLLGFPGTMLPLTEPPAERPTHAE